MISGIILAAGSARRMGRIKQLLPLCGKSMVWQVANTACRSKIDQVVLVTGAYRDEIAAAVGDLDLSLVHNPKWQDGQAGSLKTGLHSLPDKVEAVMFLLADQPMLTPGLINALIDKYHNCGQSIICPIYKNKRGNPVLFDWKLWKTSLHALQGDRGARQVIADNPGSVAFVPVDSADIFCDVDTDEDYKKMCDLFYKKTRTTDCEK